MPKQSLQYPSGAHADTSRSPGRRRKVRVSKRSR
jgi:hypothetical protein